jgi:A/G-specific adenine glycosylase
MYSKYSTGLIVYLFISTVQSFFITNMEKFSSYNFKSNEIIYCRESLLKWYTLVKRPLPWREESNKTPYAIWVSEIMCQQTRVDTVIPYWKRWLDRYPNVYSLSEAKPEDINFLWAGLGYYRRG